MEEARQPTGEEAKEEEAAEGGGLYGTLASAGAALGKWFVF